MDETSAHHFDPETKQQSKQWEHVTSPTPVKFRKIASAGKIMASVFWDSEGVLMTGYLERGKTVTGVYYAELIRKLRSAIKEIRRGKLSHGVLLHQGNYTCPHPCCGNGCNSRMRLRIAQSSGVFTRPGSIWLPRVPIFERFASWTELWLWWRGHPHDKLLVRTARKTVLRGRCKLASTSMGKVRCAWKG